MENSIFLIQKGWIDPMENHNSTGYIPFGYMITEQEANMFCESEGFWTKKDCWGIMPGEKMPKYKYNKIILIK